MGCVVLIDTDAEPVNRYKLAWQIMRQEWKQSANAASEEGVLQSFGSRMKSTWDTSRWLLGKVKMSKAWNVQRHSHRPAVADSAPPEGVDYDAWLGPAPFRPFNANRFHGNWQWFRDYGNGDIGNDGVHDIDMARFGLGDPGQPIRVTAHGSRIDLGGEREYPDNMMVTYQFPDDRVLIYEDRGWTPYGLHGYDSGNAFYGTEGYMMFTRRGFFEVRLGRKEEPGPTMRGGAGMPEHVTGFLDCVRSRQQPSAPAELAHLTCSLVHLGEVAFRVGRVLHFDPATERVEGDEEADALLTKEYRKPWGLPGTA